MIVRRDIVLILLLAFPASSRAQCCGHNILFTLRQEAARSDFVAYVRVEVPKEADFAIPTYLSSQVVLKDGAGFAKRTGLMVPYAVPVKDLPNPPQFLVFGKMLKDTPELTRGELGGPALVDYARGLLAAAPKGNVEVLRYCFEHLGSSEPAVALDANLEFEQATPADVARAGPKLNPAKLRRWLADDKLTHRISLYAYLLGVCGDKRDVVMLRELIERYRGQESRFVSLDSLLIGYTLLDPTEGFATMRQLAGERSNGFMQRYHTLRTVRFFHDARPGIIAKKDLLSVIGFLLDQDDIADLAIEDLRKGQHWDLTERVMAVSDREKTPPIVRQAVLRYAIQCPDERCKVFVAAERKKNPEKVQGQEQILNLEDNKQHPEAH